MIYSDEYMPSTSEPLIRDFCDMFGGSFRADAVCGEVSYYDKDFIHEYAIPDTKTEFIDLVSQSIKQKKNLFLDKLIEKAVLPKSAII